MAKCGVYGHFSHLRVWREVWQVWQTTSHKKGRPGASRATDGAAWNDQVEMLVAPSAVVILVITELSAPFRPN